MDIGAAKEPLEVCRIPADEFDNLGYAQPRDPLRAEHGPLDSGFLRAGHLLIAEESDHVARRARYLRIDHLADAFRCVEDDEHGDRLLLREKGNQTVLAVEKFSAGAEHQRSSRSRPAALLDVSSQRIDLRLGSVPVATVPLKQPVVGHRWSDDAEADPEVTARGDGFWDVQIPGHFENVGFLYPGCSF